MERNDDMVLSSLENCSAVRFAALSVPAIVSRLVSDQALVGRGKARAVRQVAFHLGKTLETLLQHIVDIAHRKGDALPLVNDALQALQVAFDLAPDMVRKLRGILQHVLVDLGGSGSARPAVNLGDLVVDLLRRFADQ